MHTQNNTQSKWTDQDEIRWWAEHLLNLADTGDYDKLMRYLTTAQEEGYLSELKQACDDIVKERMRERKKVRMLKGTVRKTRLRRSTALRAA